MSDLLNVDLTDISAFLAATAALGAAAAGLVDSTKAFNGGISNAGFGTIKRALEPFEAALKAAIGDDMGLATIRGAWINGLAMDDQIAKTKAMIHLGLSADTATRLTVLPNRVDAALLETIAANLDAGAALTPDQQAGLNRFDAAVESRLRGAYARADQIYRNASKILAGVFAMFLSTVGGWIIVASKNGNAFSLDYLHSRYFALALIVGAVAVPLAPVAKDLSSSLAAGVKAMQSAGG